LRIGLWPTATAVAGCFSSVVGSTVQPLSEMTGVFLWIVVQCWTRDFIIFYKKFMGVVLSITKVLRIGGE
jgi:hypothetical protein